MTPIKNKRNHKARGSEACSAFAECPRCRSRQFVYVHAHTQCRMCGLIVDPCCGGEMANTNALQGTAASADPSLIDNNA